MLDKKTTSHEYLSFTDGLLVAVEAKDGEIKRNISFPFSYDETTMGINRFYTARMAGSSIKAVLAVPLDAYFKSAEEGWEYPNPESMVVENTELRGLLDAKLVECMDLRTGNTKIFALDMMQIKAGQAPAHCLLTLKEAEAIYDDARKTYEHLGYLVDSVG